MTPVKRTILVETDYWDCGCPGHKHKKEEVAAKCMAAASRKATAQPVADKRLQMIRAARAVILGETLIDAGLRFGVTSKTCKQWLRRVLRASIHPPVFLGQLPSWFYWCTWDEIPNIRAHKNFWLERLDALEKRWSWS